MDENLPDGNAGLPGLRALRQAAVAVQAKVDPLGWGPATAKVLARAGTNPAGLTTALTRLLVGSAQVPVAAAGRALALPVTPPVEPDPKDRRFDDPAWRDNAYFFALRSAYDVAARWVDDLLAAGSHDDDLVDRKAAMALHLMVDALAPTNFAPTNPTALVRAFQTGGASLAKGAAFAIEDLRERGGFPLKVDTSGFRLGENLACTPGKVIYRNDLIELLQYAPQTEQVHAVPILMSPPWINKYYVMDLAPGRSFVEWAVQHNRTVFMISYRNPDESMRGVTMDDYLEQGLLAALDVVEAVTRADRIDVVGLCLGGAMTGMGAAYLTAGGDQRLGSITLQNTMLDYSCPGDLGTMVDPPTLERLNARMRETGFLAAEDMASAFDILRARDLIFRYIPTRWLAGEEPPAFDILAWNGDSTRMPAAMHSSYLTSLYGRNALAEGTMELAGRTLDLGAVDRDTYVVGAVNDHIVPWRSSYAATRLLGGSVRYVLSSGGHIAGIVNPPSPKSWHETVPAAAEYPPDPDDWRETAQRRQGSWWEDWVEWANQRAGDLVKPPRMGNRKHRPIEDAPGTYVHG